MGTNYHWHQKSKSCETCGHDEAKVIHIGKSSLGWVFMLHMDPEEGLNTLEDWQELWKEPGSVIYSEYGTRTPPDKMLDIITDRGNTSNEKWDSAALLANGAVRGPNGLYRGSRNFVPPDNATYDLVYKEFS